MHGGVHGSRRMALLGMTSMEMTGLIAAGIALLTALTAFVNWWVRSHATQPRAGNTEAPTDQEATELADDHAPPTSGVDQTRLLR